MSLEKNGGPRGVPVDGAPPRNLGQPAQPMELCSGRTMNIHAEAKYSLASVQVSFCLHVRHQIFAFVENSFSFFITGA